MEKTTAEETTTTTIPSDDAQAARRPRARRGFGAMDAERVRAIARLGGKAAHDRGTAHEFTPEEARLAGRKGGLAPHRPRTRSKGKAPAAVQPPPNEERASGTPADRG